MSLDEAVAALVAARPVILPTDTVYGVAVDPSRPGATARLFAVKARPTDVALPVLAADAEQAFDLAIDVPPLARRLAEACWPGGLTMVLRRREGLRWDLGGADDRTIGLRVPDHDVPRGLARAVGPLATSSANRHGRPTPETAAEAATELGEAGIVVVDGGRCAGAPSTVVALHGGSITILREGRISRAELERLSTGR